MNGRAKAPRLSCLAATLLLLAAATPAAAGAPDGPPPHAVADASTLPDTVDTATLLNLLRVHSPVGRAVQARGEVAAADLVGAERYPNPELDYAANVFLGGARPDSTAIHQVMVRQPLLVGGQRGARRDTARRGLDAARADVELTLTELARDARLALAEAQAAVAREAAVGEVIAGVERLSRVVGERHKSGHASRYDIARMELELDRLVVTRAGYRAEADRAARALGVLLGLPGWTPRVVEPLAPAGVASMAAATVAIRSAPILAAEREIDAARAGVELARSERWPDLHIGVGTSLGHSAFAGELLVGVGVEVPLFDFGEGEIARARAEVVAAEAQLDATRAGARAQAESALAELDKRRAALTRFEETVPGKLAEIAEMAEVAYRGGQASLLDLLDVLDQEHEVREQRIELLAAVVAAEVEWLFAIGRVWDVD